MDDQRTDRERSLVKLLRLIALVEVFALLAIRFVPQFLPRPRYEYVMDYYYRRVASAVIGVFVGFTIEMLIRWRNRRKNNFPKP